MIINKINISNLRNLTCLELAFKDEINIIYGENGIGKTSIIESILLLSVGKSYKTFKETDVIKKEEEVAFIKGITTSKGFCDTIEVGIGKNKKMTRVNGVEKKRMIDFIGHIKTVFFVPEDLDLVKGTPATKRSFIDMFICQLDKEYYFNLSSYNKILKQKNKLLKDSKQPIPSHIYELLKVYNQQISFFSSKIWEKRDLYFKQIEQNATIFLNDVFKEQATFEFKYTKNIIFSEIGSVFYKQEAENQLEKLIEREIFLKKSVFGVHKDDFSIKINNMDARIFASQGQQRLIALALKISQLKVFKEATNEYPILLLDDIFSELDEIKIQNLLSFLTKNKIQTIITSTFIPTTIQNINPILIKGENHI